MDANSRIKMIRRNGMYTIISIIVSVIVIGLAVFTLFLERGGMNNNDDDDENMEQKI